MMNLLDGSEERNEFYDRLEAHLITECLRVDEITHLGIEYQWGQKQASSHVVSNACLFVVRDRMKSTSAALNNKHKYEKED